MTAPRDTDARIDWFLSHMPDIDGDGDYDSGACANHSWKSLGGDKGNPPAWQCDNANEVHDKVKKSGRYWTGTPKRGGLVLYRYGSNGHAAICYDDAGTKIATTNPSNGEWTGVEPIGYPSKWGASSSARIWTDEYNGVRFPVGEPEIDHGEVYLSKLVYGQQDSDSVKRLQMHLNDHKLAAPGNVTLPVSGNYADQTDTVVRACQDQHHLGSDAAGKSSVGPQQAEHLFAGCDCIVTDDRPAQPTPPPTTEVPVANDDYWYSGKPPGSLIFDDSYKKLDVDKWAPKQAGLIMSMLYANIDGEGEIRVRLIRDPDDATAYQTYYVKGGDNCLITHVWFEQADANRKLWWELCSMDGTTHTVTTRYCKFAVIG